MQPNVTEIARAVAQELQAIRSNVSLEQALWLAEQVKAKAKEFGFPCVVAVSDNAARPVLVECMDGAYIASYDVAFNKAFTVVSLKMSTSDLKPLAQPGGSLYGIQFTNQGKIVIFGGGDALEIGGKILGGIGVSGGSAEEDTALSAYGKQVFTELFC